jgi:flagellar basal-body rod modification protein FlgD
MTTAAAAATPSPAAATPAPPASSATGAPSSAPPTNPGSEPGKNDFLKLMIAQLQAQNPLEPTEGAAYIGQLAQFSQLEQVTNLAQSSEQSAAAQRVSQAVALIGHTVSFTDPTTGATRQGPVQSVQITSSGASLTIEGTPGIALANVTEVS